MNSIAWCPPSRQARSSAASRALKIDGLPRSNSPRMSTTSPSGSGRLLTRWRSSSSSRRFSGRTPGMARMNVDTDGVALPSSSTAPWSAALRQAISRASYRGRWSDW